MILAGAGSRGIFLPATSPLSVLVIDDEESHASLISRVISKNGHHVDVVHRAEDGLAKFRDQNYDLVITDVFMEGMGGIKAITGIRQSWPGVPIIAISAGFSDMSAEAALKTAREVGADAILPKPFPLVELRLTMARLLEGRRPGK
jgi:DNA-binding response OmpR family regulator